MSYNIDLEEMAMDYCNGSNLYDLMDQYKIPYSFARKSIIDKGVLRTRSEAGKLAWDQEKWETVWTKEEEKKAISMLKEGCGFEEVAKAVGRTYYGVIHQNQRKWKIPWVNLHATQKPYLEPSEDLCYILGVIEGDGHVSKNNAIRLKVKDKLFAENFSKALHNINLNSRVITEKAYYKKCKGLYAACSGSIIFTKWYRRLKDDFINGFTTIIGDNQSFMRAFVRGFYESEGSLKFGKSPSDRYVRLTITMYNTNEILIRFVAELINKLGYKMSVCGPYGPYNKKNKLPLYVLTITGTKEDKISFIKEINPCIKNRGCM